MCPKHHKTIMPIQADISRIKPDLICTFSFPFLYIRVTPAILHKRFNAKACSSRRAALTVVMEMQSVQAGDAVNARLQDLRPSAAQVVAAQVGLHSGDVLVTGQAKQHIPV